MWLMTPACISATLTTPHRRHVRSYSRWSDLLLAMALFLYMADKSATSLLEPNTAQRHTQASTACVIAAVSHADWYLASWQDISLYWKLKRPEGMKGGDGYSVSTLFIQCLWQRTTRPEALQQTVWLFSQVSADSAAPFSGCTCLHTVRLDTGVQGRVTLQAGCC